jgi:hypothetical protein
MLQNVTFRETRGASPAGPKGNWPNVAPPDQGPSCEWAVIESCASGMASTQRRDSLFMTIDYMECKNE